MLITLCIIMYGLNEFYFKGIFKNLWMQGYYNDYLAGIILLAAVELVTLLYSSKEVSFIQTVVVMLLAGLYWEFIAPLYILDSVTDPRDLLVYEAGGIICFIINKNMIRRMKMKCLKCQYDLSDKVRFCPRCGEKVVPVRYCSNCGEKMEEGAKFCAKCGNPVMHENIVQEPVQEENTDKTNKLASKTEEAGIDFDKTEIEDIRSVLEPEGQTINGGIDSEKAVPEYGTRTLESFKNELKELGDRDSESKAVIIIFGTGVFYKHFYPLLKNDEKILAIRNIQSKFLFARHRKEFVAVTDNRVIKFEKMQYFKPKTESCYLSDIREIMADSPSNAVSGTFIGEKLGIIHSDGQINMRMVGKEAASQLRDSILAAKERAYTDNHSDCDVQPPRIDLMKEEGKYRKKKSIIGLAIVGILVVAALFMTKSGETFSLNEDGSDGAATVEESSQMDEVTDESATVADQQQSHNVTYYDFGRTEVPINEILFDDNYEFANSSTLMAYGEEGDYFRFSGRYTDEGIDIEQAAELFNYPDWIDINSMRDVTGYIFIDDAYSEEYNDTYYMFLYAGSPTAIYSTPTSGDMQGLTNLYGQIIEIYRGADGVNVIAVAGKAALKYE